MTNKVINQQKLAAYKAYVARLKGKITDFDFGDCPPAEEFAKELVEQFLSTDRYELSSVVDDAIALLQQWKIHASQVIEAEDES